MFDVRSKVRRTQVAMTLVTALLCASLWSSPACAEVVQIVYTSDQHYGISRKSFRGEKKVPAATVNAAMVEACLDGLPGLSCNRMEAGRPGLSYTWDTLQACREETPERPLFFILGNPDYALLPHWHRGLELPELCQLVVVPRGEGSEKNFLAATESMWPGARPCEPVLPGSRRMRLPGGGQVHFVPLPWISVSASRIRHRWLHGLNVDFLVPKPVLELLDAHRKTVLAHWLPEAKTDDA